tara:strand:- start:20053 stop:20667 length:615 start_codon:yes stop_codon:yes gene_type:complete
MTINVGKMRVSAAEKTKEIDSLLLLGCENCKVYKSDNPDVDLRNLYEPEKNIFYKIAVTKNELSNSYEEYGVGEIVITKEQFFLKRKNILKIVNIHHTFGATESSSRFVSEIDLPEDHSILVFSYLPEDYRSLLSLDHSVICSEDEFSANPVQLEENTLLGRLNNRLQSIDQNELWSILLQGYDGKDLQKFLQKFTEVDNEDTL